MRSIAGRRRGWKRKVSSGRKAVRDMLEMARIDDVDVKVSTEFFCEFDLKPAAELLLKPLEVR